MYFSKDIIKEGNKDLETKCAPVKLPLSPEDEECIRSLAEYMLVSGNDELTKQYNIRPGVGIAAPQVDVLKRMFAMSCTDFLDENQTQYIYNWINPKIIAASKEMTYLPDGEGCLSVERDTTGLVTPRHVKIKVEGFIYNYATRRVTKKTMTLLGYPAIVFQHEYDHLDGIMYTSKMYKPEELGDKAFPLYTYEESDEENKDEK